MALGDEIGDARLLVPGHLCRRGGGNRLLILAGIVQLPQVRQALRRSRLGGDQEHHRKRRIHRVIMFLLSSIAKLCATHRLRNGCWNAQRVGARLHPGKFELARGVCIYRGSDAIRRDELNAYAFG